MFVIIVIRLMIMPSTTYMPMLVARAAPLLLVKNAIIVNMDIDAMPQSSCRKKLRISIANSALPNAPSLPSNELNMPLKISIMHAYATKSVMSENSFEK